jgi:hypothetical protein
MYSLKLAVFFLLYTLTGCSHSNKFDRDIWIKNSDINDYHNPRARMVQDVMKNQLKSGMSRKSVLDLLGQPYKEGIERRLPKNTILPDSISATNPENLRPENEKRSVAGFNKFIQLYAKPIMLMRYPVGWSIIDAKFLIIRLDNKGLVEEYWVEET